MAHPTVQSEIEIIICHTLISFVTQASSVTSTSTPKAASHGVYIMWHRGTAGVTLFEVFGRLGQGFSWRHSSWCTSWASHLYGSYSCCRSLGVTTKFCIESGIQFRYGSYSKELQLLNYVQLFCRLPLIPNCCGISTGVLKQVHYGGNHSSFFITYNNSPC